MHKDIPYKNNPMGYYEAFNNIVPISASIYPGGTINGETVGSEFHFYCDIPENTGLVIVDWGDGNKDEYTTSKISHTYSTSQKYTVNIKGNYTKLRFGTLLDTDPNYDSSDSESAKLLTYINIKTSDCRINKWKITYRLY